MNEAAYLALAVSNSFATDMVIVSNKLNQGQGPWG